MIRIQPTAIACLILLPVLGSTSPAATPPTVLVFSKSGTGAPRYALWNGSAWSSPAAMPTVGAEAYWVVTRNCPLRDETVCVTFDVSENLKAAFLRDGGWTNFTQLAQNTGQKAYRVIDAVYEQNSGRCLVVYYDDQNANMGYHLTDGGALTAKTSFSRPSSSKVNFVSLVARPGSNDVFLLAADVGSRLSVNHWNGAAWSGWSTITTTLNSYTLECFALACEAESTKALLAYARSGQAQPRYRVWNGASWSSESSMPSVGAAARFIRLASDLETNRIVFGCLDSSKNISVNVWNGTTWASNFTATTSAPNDDIRNFDVAFEGGGGRPIVVYTRSGQSALRYRTWDGASWSSELTGANLGDTARIVQLRTGLLSGEVHGIASDTSDELSVFRWNGIAMSAATQLEGSLGGDPKAEQFMIAAQPAAALVPADVPYAHEFESAMGPEWSNAQRESAPALTNFAGRHRTSKLKLALNTTPGETYRLRFDFYAIDSWDGSDTTLGPDSFIVLANGDEIFRETFAHDAGKDFSYVFPHNERGHYGFAAGAQDGVFRGVQVSFVATQNITTLTFTGEFNGSNSGDFDDESWGIDNIAVTVARFADVTDLRKLSHTAATTNQYLAGLHWADLNNDGDLDAIVTGGQSQASIITNTNAGAEYFSTKLSSGMLYGQGALVDIDNDGDIDFWASAHNVTFLEKAFLNNGEGVLTDGSSPGFTAATGNECSAAADVNGNGWSDIVMFAQNGNWIGHHGGAGSPTLTATKHTSYGLNDSGDAGNGLTCASGDVNNDGFVDFFYLYDGGKLFLSKGNGTYARTNHGISIVVNDANKCAAAWGDSNNNGLLDLYFARYEQGESGSLWRNAVNWQAASPTGAFENITTVAGITDRAGRRSCAWGDYDNDGHLDLFVATHTGRTILYRNKGDGTFEPVDEGTGITGDCHDAVFVDVDNDGDLDLVIARRSQPMVLLENRTNNSNFLKVRVLGAGAGKTNKAAIGTRVELWSADGSQFLMRRDVGTARGGGVEPLWLHFGGVSPQTAYELRVYFRSGVRKVPVTPGQVATNINGRVIPQMITVEEPVGVKIIQWSEVRNKPAAP